MDFNWLCNWLRLATVALSLVTPALHAERIVLVAGGGNQAAGAATNCQVHTPFGIDFDRSGNIYVVEMAGGERVLRIDARGMLTVFAGTGAKGNSGDNGPANEAQFNGMHSLAAGPADDLFIAD